MSSTTKRGSSLSITIFIVFLILKLTGAITWSWWWVTCPLWIGLAVWIGSIFIMLCVTAILLGIAYIIKNK